MNFFSLFKRNLIFKFKKKIQIDNENPKFNSLDDLFNHYGTDKCNHLNSLNCKGHGYSRFYTKHLETFKNKRNNILEIGSFAGASAASFVKYLPGSKIFCFDINISNFKFSSKSIEVFGIDISNIRKTEKTITNLYKKNNFQFFDLIIDDGSHNLSDILISFNYLFKHLKSGGIYVIEDFKFPNYYNYNKDIEDILVDDLLEKILKKENFNSEIINKESQNYLFNAIDKIEINKGNLPHSDICFIKKKN